MGTMSAPLHSVPVPEGADTTQAGTFEEFFRAEHPGLYRALCLVVADRHEAEDVAQVAFLRVYERWDRVAGMENPQGYLYRVSMNEFRSRYRRTLRATKRTLSSRTSDDAFAVIDDHDAVVRALRDLIPQQRAAIVLTSLLGYSSEEAGEMLGLAPSTVRVLSTRAREAMRAKAVTVDDR
jgi:RNA polymerase sigma factor (sigma-70 family)